jgi:hypothetical protein
VRVRQSKPSVDEVVGHYDEDPLQMVAHYEGRGLHWVLKQYLSKVGSFRRGYEPLPDSDRLVEVTNAFWLQLSTRMEGAPEWLEVEVIRYWKGVIDAWKVSLSAFGEHDPYLEPERVYIRVRLDDFLQHEQTPAELP